MAGLKSRPFKTGTCAEIPKNKQRRNTGVSSAGSGQALRFAQDDERSGFARKESIGGSSRTANKALTARLKL
jgi:hypothetical protein